MDPTEASTPAAMSRSVNAIEVYWLPASVLIRIRLNSDQGTQYASAQITEFALNNGLIRSMGLTGICWASMPLLKDSSQRSSPSSTTGACGPPRHARLEVGAWIEDRYNRRRRHVSLGQITPVAFEMQYSNEIADFQEAA